MWGQGTALEVFNVPVRIIPTRVGTSCASFCKRTAVGDHPHACGDKLFFTCALNQSIGSSPRVWGQADNSFLPTRNVGIIPTRVGTSRKEQANAVEDEDHPHACGDKGKVLPCFQSPSGSSPRVWGQERFRVADFCVGRIIPTRVGTSLLLVQRCKARRDHPHACGDKLYL